VQFVFSTYFLCGTCACVQLASVSSTSLLVDLLNCFIVFLGAYVCILQ
jgi:hypothetical protein